MFSCLFRRAGFKIDSMQADIVEMKLTYDDHDADPSDLKCPIGTEYNKGEKCTHEFNVPDDMEPPILVYYELTNFHQNHRSYIQSRDDYQLAGQVGNQDKVQEERCDPLNQLGGITLNPCGLIANTFFNDIFKLSDGQVDANGNELFMSEEGIAWQSDLDWLFSQPDGFRSEECPEGSTDAECCSYDAETEQDWSCETPFVDEDGTRFRFFYPDDNTTQYLYETYPDIVSPLEGVTNEHFVVWMRVALQPTFRKLYGWINQPIKKGQKLSFDITANYVVTRFKGSKSLIVTTNNIFGGRNVYFGPMFYWVGFFCLGSGTFFALKHIFRPRKLADRAYLHFKTD